jgi:methionyl-tRNA synthetase
VVDLDDLPAEVSGLLDEAQITQALERIWVRVRRLNRYVEETRPWDLAKEDGDAGRLDEVLYNLAEGLRVLTLLLHPYMPEASGRLLETLAEGDRELAPFGSRGGGQRVGELSPLFPKIEVAPA